QGTIGTGNASTFNYNETSNQTINRVGANSAGAAIGAGGNQVNETATVNISAANITLNDGTGNGARFGHSGSNNGPGNVTVTATGNIALNAPNGLGTAIRTTDNVTLQAGGSISEAAASVILANSLTTTSNAGTTLSGTTNAVNAFNATNAASGNISLMNTGNPLTISGIS